VFDDCTALSELHVPAGVQEIGYSAFKNVPHVYYTGSATGNWGQTALN